MKKDSKPKIAVPIDKRFSGKVLEIPNSPDGLCIGKWEPLMNDYSWVTRGSVLFVCHKCISRFVIPRVNIGIGEIYERVQIVSPVSGLLLHNSHNLIDRRSGWRNGHDNGVCSSLLLPEGEREAEDSQFVFSDLIKFVVKKQYIAYHDESLEKMNAAVKEQLTRKSQVVDALPKYNDYINEAMIHNENLRPFLRPISKGDFVI